MERTRIINGRVITPYRILDNATVEFCDGRISYVGEKPSGEEADKIIDAKGNYVSPGFIELHSHGGGGHDFMDGTLEAILGAVEMHAKFGTTSFLPTTLTCTNEELHEFMETFKIAKEKNEKGSRLLGLHLEGPYFALSQAGAQDPRYIKNPTPEDYMEILSWTDDILRWSIAPELPGALELGDELRKRGIITAIGHSDAEYEDVLLSCEHGYSHVTHLYSGMNGVHRRNAYRFLGVVESAFLIDDLTVEIIADGHHLPAELIKLIYKIKGPEKIALITDSLRGAGMPDGDSIAGSLKNGQHVIIEGGVAKLPDRSAFAGSVATSNRLIQTVVFKAGIPLLDAVNMASLTPAKILGMEKDLGSISCGKMADIVIFDDDINVSMTIIGGKTVFSA